MNKCLHNKKLKLAIVFSLTFIFFSFLYFIKPINYTRLVHQSVTVVAADGTALRVFSGLDGSRKHIITLDSTSDDYIRFLIAYEDAGFYSHFGVEPKALFRAAWQWLLNGKVISGGSTITMQAARMIGDFDRSIIGKFRQIILAMKLELQLKKQEILTLYINNIPFGGTIKGVEYASRVYFNKPSKDLNISEAILLAKIPQSPSKYRPDIRPKRARHARREITNILFSAGKIDENEYSLINHSPMLAKKHITPILTPLLARKLKNRPGYQPLIVSNIDYEIQNKIDLILSYTTSNLARKTSLSIIVMENISGKVVGFKGSAEFLNDQRFGHVDMTSAIRSPGSTLKPFIYAMAIDQGLIHSRSLLADIPYNFNGYKPQNIDDNYIGKIPADDALRASKNIAAVQLMNAISPHIFVQNLKNSKIDLYHQGDNLSVILGGTGINLINLVKLYSSLANKGVVVNPRLSASDVAEQSRFMSENAAYIIWYILSQNSGPNYRVAKHRRKIAWKTGTSYGYRDAWAIGVSSDFTVGVWTGRPDGTPIVGRYGRSHAGPILYDIFDQLPKDIAAISKPKSVKVVDICWPSGLQNNINIASAKCNDIKRGALTINGFTPRTLNLQGKHIVKGGLPIEVKHFEKHNVNNSAGLKNRNSIKIQFPEDKMQFFKSQVYEIDIDISLLNGDRDQVYLYLNNRPIKSENMLVSELDIENQLVACYKHHCDKINFTVN